MGIEIDAVTRRFGDVVAVDGVSLDVAPGAFVSLLGPSGSGKSTLLRLVGGFEQPDSGSVRLGGEDVTAMPPQRRPTATVFQSYALFPPLSVAENVGYGLDVRGVARAERRRRVEAALDGVGLAGLGDRRVSALSGGQQQRVALARALAVVPSVLLFDEPLSNLDLALRESTRAEIRRLQRESGITALYVTHDQQEALAISDRIAVLRRGRLVAHGEPRALYFEPPSAYVAGFLGGANVLTGSDAAQLTGESGPGGYALVVRPEDLSLGEPGGVPCTVVGEQFLGLVREWTVRLPEGSVVRAWLPPAFEPNAELSVRARRWAWVPDDR